MSFIFIFRWYERHVQIEQVFYDFQTNDANKPSKSPSAIYLGNVTIHFICKPENWNRNPHKLCKHLLIRTEPWDTFQICMQSLAYVSNSLKQLIELVDSLTSASVPETLSMGAHGWSLDFGWTSFSTNKIPRKNPSRTAHFPRSSRAMWQVTHACLTFNTSSSPVHMPKLLMMENF